MAIGKVLQTNFTAGVLDPKLAAREDTTFYYNGLSDAKNLMVMPQGGAFGRPGMEFIRAARPVLAALSLSGATITAPQGGTASALHDGNAETAMTTGNNLAGTNPYVAALVVFPTPVTVSAIDILNYRLEAGILTGEFRVQYLEGASWVDFGTPFDWDATVRSRRRSAASPVTAASWRVVRIGSTSIAAKAIIGEIRFWSAAADLSNVRLVPFAYSTEEAYMMVVTDRNMDVLTGRSYQGSISIPHLSASLPVLRWTQAIDNMILFHKSVRPERVFRQGGHDEFDFRQVPFENVPQYDYGAGVGGQDEVQHLSVSGFGEGSNITLLLEGERTSRVGRGTGESVAAVATKIQAALRALVNTSDDGITVSWDALGWFVVTFAGEDGKQPWDEISVDALSGDSVWSTSRQVKGQYPGEDIMSDTRGWPRCGTFHKRRLHMGGVPGVPDAHFMSRVGYYYDFDTERDDDTKALLFRAETEQVGAIYNIVAGRHLTLFANDGEFYYPTEAITDESSPKLSTRAGSKEGLPVFEVDGALHFVQGVRDDEDTDREIGTSAREFVFEETRQAYDANMLSRLSSHLLNNPVDVGLRKALSTDDATVEIYINEDGSGVAYTALRSDGVDAFVPISTRDGDRLLAVGVDKRRRVYFAVERTINGAPVRFIEMWNKDLLLDCGGIRRMTAESHIAVSDGQSLHVWSFANPATVDAIGVRVNGGRLGVSQYSVDLGSKTVTLHPSVAETVKSGDIVRISRMEKTVAGLSHLEGETVMTVVDGTAGDAYAVASGEIVLSDWADTEIQFGFDYEVSGKLMPLRIPDGDTLSGEKVRVVNAAFDLYKTGGIEIRANNGPWREIALQVMDDEVLDRSTAEMSFTGRAEKRGLLGHVVGAPLEFRRPGPTPFTVLSATREVSL